MRPQTRAISGVSILLLTSLACGLSSTPVAPTPTPFPALPTDTSTPATASATPSPPAVPAPTLPAGSGPCQADATVDFSVYTRPSLLADIFGTLSPGLTVTITGRTADGWLGFDPGVAQAANMGVFRLRWIPPGASVGLTGNCAGVPIESWVPAPGVCYDMPMEAVEVHASADPGSSVSATVNVGQFLAITGRTPTGWLFVNGDTGNVPGVIGFIAELTMNANGPCDSIPTINP